jgi:hypothetical protein
MHNTKVEISGGVPGVMLAQGDTAQTCTGQVTTPFPKVDMSTNRKVTNTLKRVDEWLLSNGIAEAETRKDEFNLVWMNNTDPKKLTPCDRDLLNEYLFGDPIPVSPPFLKPLLG